jgi:hypothetical protein
MVNLGVCADTSVASASNTTPAASEKTLKHRDKRKLAVQQDTRLKLRSALASSVWARPTMQTAAEKFFGTLPLSVESLLNVPFLTQRSVHGEHSLTP